MLELDARLVNHFSTVFIPDENKFADGIFLPTETFFDNQ